MRRQQKRAAARPKPGVSRDLAQRMKDIGDGTLAIALNNFDNWPQDQTVKDQAGPPWVCCDRQRRTCILISKDDGVARYIPLDVEYGLELCKDAVDDFEDRFCNTMTQYPVTRAAQLYVSYAAAIGASDEVLKILGKLTSITKQEYEMARAKKLNGAAATTTAKKAATKKAAPTTKKAAPTTKKAPTEKKASTPAKQAAKKSTESGGAERISAASMFKELILEGKLTDNQIFSKVQDKFGLDEKKRGYVNWYRNFLRKQGVSVPEPRV